jgi:hypothetical protein
LGAIDNSSNSNGGYGNFTSLSTDLLVASDHTIRLTPGYSGFQFGEWFRVWIDLDQNGDLTDAGERVFDSGGTSNSAVEGTITIPASATPGPTRMRVSMRYNGAPASACTAEFAYGEVEDYCVNLIANNGNGLPENTSYGTVQVFPQPADHQLSLRLPAGLSPFAGTIHVFDATGKRVLTRTFQENTTLQTSDLADGLYTFRLSGNAGIVGQGRFMVLHSR